MRASSSPLSVRVPFSDPAAVDPEEAFVASLSSCHMLWFLSIAAGRGWVVDSYLDNAEGLMTRNDRGKLFISSVTLRPLVKYDGDSPTHEQEMDMHHEAHESCFIANSVRAQVIVAIAR